MRSTILKQKHLSLGQLYSGEKSPAHLPASTKASYVTSNRMRSCGSIRLACFGGTLKKEASNLDMSLSVALRLGTPYTPEIMVEHFNLQTIVFYLGTVPTYANPFVSFWHMMDLCRNRRDCFLSMRANSSSTTILA